MDHIAGIILGLLFYVLIMVVLLVAIGGLILILLNIFHIAKDMITNKD